MNHVTALVLTDGSNGRANGSAQFARIRIAGLTLLERAVLAARRAGIERVHVLGEHAPDEEVLQRLRGGGLTVTCSGGRSAPFALLAAAGATVVVIPLDTVFAPGVLTALLEQAELSHDEAALAIDTRPDARSRLLTVSQGFVTSLISDGHAASANLVVLAPKAVERVRGARTFREALWQLARVGKLRGIDVAPRFWARIHDAREASGLEGRYIRGLNGNEFFFTKVLRRQSVHLTRALLRTPLSPNQITLLGFLVSVVAAYAFAIGGYWPALAGAALYYLSTLLDCSDGEVARCTFRTSAFGCWLETATDAASTVLILAGIVGHVLTRTGHGADKIAASLALVATALLLIMTSYQRRRVARADPNQYERLLQQRLAGGNAGTVGRFASWGSQFIKRACVAHLILFLALIGQVRVLVYLWAFGAMVALIIGTGVHRIIMGDRRRRTLPNAAGAALPSGGRT